MTDSHVPAQAARRYKFVELSVVTAETLEVAVNEWVASGWLLDAIHFVSSESSHRPSMAFIAFVRSDHASAPHKESARAVSDGVPGVQVITDQTTPTVVPPVAAAAESDPDVDRPDADRAD